MSSPVASLPAGSLSALGGDDVRVFIEGQRWFAGRGERVLAVEPVLAATLHASDPLVVLGVVEVTFATGLHDRYQLVLTDEPGPDGVRVCRLADGRPLHDALRNPTSLRALGQLTAADLDTAATTGTVRFRTLVADLPSAPSTARPLGADSTNSAAVFDERVLLKAYRRITPGANPELEMLTYLTRIGFEGVPEILGWWEHVDDTSEATLGLLQRYIPESVDGWTLATADAANPEPGCGLVDELADLGTLTAALHGALAAGPDDGSFTPEWPHADQLGLLAASLDERLSELAASGLMDDHLAVIAELRARLGAAARTPDIGCLIRGHGDYHLGQVLRASGRWWIVDFEGEPMRESTERRRRRSPLRDVAGMLRSLDYAAVVGGATDESAARWRREARHAFLDAYTGAPEAPRLLPRQRESTRDLLFVMELEKVLYEIEYERAHRPEWIPIPLGGLRALAEPEGDW